MDAEVEEAPRFAFVPGRFMFVATALRRERDQLAGLRGKEVRRRVCEAVVLVEVVVFASLVLAGVGRHEDRLFEVGKAVPLAWQNPRVGGPCFAAAKLRLPEKAREVEALERRS